MPTSGALKKYMLANGQVNVSKTFDSAGLVSGIMAGTSSATNLQNQAYRFDSEGNLEYRADYNRSFSEDFAYDALNRLDTITTHAGGYNVTRDVRLSNLGNIKNLGNGDPDYEYGIAVRPNAVITAKGQGYAYDANGNMEWGGGRTYQWTAFNKPSRIDYQGKATLYGYGPDHERILKQSADGQSITHYISGTEVKLSGSEVEYRYNISVGNQVVASVRRSGSIGATVNGYEQYFLHDHLGSVSAILNADGSKYQDLSYDAWGNRRATDWQTLSSPALNSLQADLDALGATEGFTGHEHDAETGLINMKGRLYDPTIGRFISADPHIQAPSNTQSFNRYSYVLNNPLSLTDPSGYFFKKLGKWLKKNWRVVAAIAVAAVLGPALTWHFAATTNMSIAAGAISSGAITGFVSGMIASGGDMRAGIIGAVTGGLAGSIGATDWGLGRKAAVHGLVGGTASVAQGGKFGHGFASSYLGKVTAPGVRIATHASRLAGGLVSGLIGGTISHAIGGKFANGAVTNSLQFLFNEMNNPTSSTEKEVAYSKGPEQTGRAIRVDGEWSSESDTVPAGFKLPIYKELTLGVSLDFSIVSQTYHYVAEQYFTDYHVDGSSGRRYIEPSFVNGSLNVRYGLGIRTSIVAPLPQGVIPFRSLPERIKWNND